MIIKVNVTFLEWSGYAHKALVGQRRFQALLPVAGKLFHETHVGPILLMQDYVKELAFEVVSGTGERLPVLLNFILKRDTTGNLPVPDLLRAASTAEEALGMLRSEVFDVLLTDVGLPEKSDIELAMEAVDVNPALRIIFSSGHGAANDDKLKVLSLLNPCNVEQIMDVSAKLTNRR